MNVDLPTPGTPVMPTRCALPVCGSSSTSSSCALFAVVGPARLDQRDRAGDGGPVPGAHPVRQSSVVSFATVVS